MSPELADADVARLVSIWLDELDVFADLAQTLTQAQWETPSPCPGWTVGDVVAHVIALESELHGEAIPDHEPDWGSLPHITNDFGKYTERPVDFRRTHGREQVVAELCELVGERHRDLTPIPTDPAELVPTFAGLQAPRRRAVQLRILDTWVHEQDVRIGANLPGGLASDGAWVCAGRFIAGLPYVWGKAVAAPIGSVLEVDVTGPDVMFTRTVEVGANGRAQFLDHQVGEPTVRVNCSWPVFVQLAAGRHTGSAGGTATVAGDSELAARILPALAVTP